MPLCRCRFAAADFANERFCLICRFATLPHDAMPPRRFDFPPMFG